MNFIEKNNGLLKIAIDACVEAGNSVYEIYQSKDFDVEIKADDSPITEADKASNNIILDFLKKTAYPVISEETALIDYAIRKNWKNVWIVDPLDGTKEFINRNGEFTINIAFITNNKPVLGVIYVPVTQTLYFGDVKSGAYKCVITEKLPSSFEKLIQNSVRLPLNNKRNKFTIVASRSHINKATKEYIKKISEDKNNVEFVSKGSSLKLCVIAEGTADYYPRLSPIMEWDIAAGVAILKASGGMIADKNGVEILFNQKDLRKYSLIAFRK